MNETSYDCSVMTECYDMRGKSPSPNWPQTLENFI